MELERTDKRFIRELKLGLRSFQAEVIIAYVKLSKIIRKGSAPGNIKWIAITESKRFWKKQRTIMLEKSTRTRPENVTTLLRISVFVFVLFFVGIINFTFSFCHYKSFNKHTYFNKNYVY